LVPGITFSEEPELGVDEFVDVLRRSTLAERRPVADRTRIATMLRHADIVMCARDAKGRLVGVSRALTDFAYCCYLSDLAVDEAVQRLGIGRELVRRTHERAGRGAMLILLAAPNAKSYHPHIGMEACDRAFTTNRRQP
jgi:predicted GNAT superfamily acetyltransferase